MIGPKFRYSSLLSKFPNHHDTEYSVLVCSVTFDEGGFSKFQEFGIFFLGPGRFTETTKHFVV